MRRAGVTPGKSRIQHRCLRQVSRNPVAKTAAAPAAFHAPMRKGGTLRYRPASGERRREPRTISYVLLIRLGCLGFRHVLLARRLGGVGPPQQVVEDVL